MGWHGQQPGRRGSLNHEWRDVDLFIDRSLPITLVEQIKGQITYAVSGGELRPGCQMPSVRELASQLDVAPMTVSRVYRELTEAHLLEARPGVGTFVADITQVGSRLTVRHGEDLRLLVDGFLRQAFANGYAPGQIRDVFLQRLEEYSPSAPAVSLALVGNFEAATDAYARELESVLQDLNPRVQVILWHELQSDLAKAVERLNGVDLVIGIPTRLQQIRSLLEPLGFQVAAVAFHVSPETRRRVASLSPGGCVGVVATYPEFLSPLLEGVLAYGSPEVHPLYALVTQEQQVKEMLAKVDVVVYASGSEKVLEWLPEGKDAFEYRHVPDHASINRLRPLLGRTQRSGGEL